MIDVRLAGIRFASESVNLFEISGPSGEPMPAVTPGAWLRLDIPNSVKRAYFIADRTERGEYVLGVRRDPDGLGSKYLHDKVKAGKRMRAAVTDVEPPDFAAKRSVLIAEDVGVFHAWSLVRAFEARGMDWKLHYDAWSRADAPFLAELGTFGSRVRTHVRGDNRGAPIDWTPIVDRIDDETRVYATVSETSRDAMTAAFERAGRDASERVRYTPISAPPPRGPVEFEVVLARSNLTVPVHQDETILAAIRGAGVDAPHFCGAGICGTCRTRVLDGTPRHLDAVLNASERAANDSMMICRSRSTSPRLVLDL